MRTFLALVTMAIAAGTASADKIQLAPSLASGDDAIAPSANTVRFAKTLTSGHSASVTFGTLDDANRGGASTPVGIFIRFENTISENFDSLEDRVLTGLFFNIDGSPDLFGPNGFATGANAVGGDRVGGQDGDILPSYWAFREDLGERDGDEIIPDEFDAPRYGLGAEPHGLFASSELLGGEEGSPPIDGLDGGLLSPTGDLPGGDLDRNGSTFPLWRDFIEVRILLRSEFFDLYGLDDINSVSWQFGQLGDGVSIPASAPIPLPTGAAMGLLGLGLLAANRRR